VAPAKKPSADTLLIKNGIIIVPGQEPRVLHDHAVLIEAGRINEIKANSDFPAGVRYGRVIDASGKVVLPGLINAHMHFYSTLVRGLGKAKPAKDFNEVLHNLWWRLDRVLLLEDCYLSALVMMLDAIRHGTTTLIDHHASPGAVNGSLAEIARAAAETGLRVCLAYEVSDRDGHEIAGQGLAENTAFIRRCQKNQNEHLKALFGLHAAFTLGEQTLQQAAALGCELKTGFHVHVAEAESDQEYSQRQFNCRVVERLHQFGILGQGTIAAHCVHVNEREMELLADTQTMVVHNPQSNLNNAVGIADIVGLQKRGVLVGLGTDAMTVNMLEELRVALWAQRLRQKDASAGFSQATAALFINNPQIASRLWGMPLGLMQPGAAGDIILVDYAPPTPLDATTALGHLVYGISQRAVDTTIVAGRVLMENHQISLPLDEERIAARSRESARKLWERF